MTTEEILSNVWMKLGFNNKTELARSLEDRRVEIIDYSIGRNRVSKTLTSLLVRIHNVNPEYLKTGEGEILLEKKTPTGGCLECLKKDGEIKGYLLELNDVRKELADCRMELSDREKLNRSG